MSCMHIASHPMVYTIIVPITTIKNGKFYLVQAIADIFHFIDTNVSHFV